MKKLKQRIKSKIKEWREAIGTELLKEKLDLIAQQRARDKELWQDKFKKQQEFLNDLEDIVLNPNYTVEKSIKRTDREIRPLFAMGSITAISQQVGKEFTTYEISLISPFRST